jgi:HEAT repeat protein
MAETRRILIGVLVFVLAASVVMAQQTTGTPTSNSAPATTSSTQSSSSTAAGTGKDVTIEQLYLSQDVELQILRTQALSEKRESQLLAIQTIQSMVHDGSLSQANPAIGVILDSLATGGLQRQVREGNHVVNNYPEVRREACNLLGDLGGQQATDALLTVVLQDNEPMVLSEAVYALGRIGLNKNNDVTGHIVWLLNRESTKRSPDNNLAFACLLAIQKLSEKNGGISDPEVINALLNVTSGNYIRDVRLKAVDTIYQLRNQQKKG